MYDPAKVAQAFSKLFQTYPSFQAGAADDALRVYFEAVEPYETGDILEAVKAFLSGTAPGVNPNFAPPAPAVAGECRRQMNLRLRALELDRLHRPRLPPPDIERPPEARERVRAMLDAMKLEQRTESVDELQAKAGKERAEKQERWLRDRGDLIEVRGSPYPVSQSLMRQMGYEVGDEDGERDVA